MKINPYFAITTYADKIEQLITVESTERPSHGKPRAYKVKGLAGLETPPYGYGEQYLLERE